MGIQQNKQMGEKYNRLVSRVAIAVFFFISGFGYASWASRIPDVQKQLKLNDAELGMMLFGLPAGLMAMLPVTGILLSRFSSRQMMLIGALFFNVMLAVLGLVSQSWQLFAVLFCFGASRNLFNISANAQSIAVQARYERPVISSFHGIWSVAGFAGAAFGTLMVSRLVAPVYHFSVTAGLLSALVIVFIRYSIEARPAPEHRSKKIILPDRKMMRFGLICFASMACEGTIYDWGAIYFEKAVRSSVEAVTLGFTLYMIAMTAGRFAGDSIAARWGSKRILQSSGLLIFTGLMLAALWPEFLPSCIGFILTGFGVSCVVPTVFAMAGRSSGMSSGSAIAAVSTIGYLGFLLVPPAVGFIAHSLNLRWSFALIALLGIVLAALVSTNERPVVTTTEEVAVSDPAD
jgi:MFS family permease